VIMLLSVTGIPEPWQRIVAVEDETEFLGHLRAIALKETVDALTDSNEPLLDEEKADVQADILRNLRIHLKDTGLTEFPESDAEQQALYERMSKQK